MTPSTSHAPAFPSPRASAEGSELLEQPEQLLQLLGVVALAEAQVARPPLALTASAASDSPDRGDNELDHDGDGDGDGSRASATTRAAKRRPTDHKKTKLELEYLRTRARELESELQALQSGRGRPLSRASHNAMIGAAWKRLVATQLRRRATSEAENALLRRELLTYAELTRTLAQTLSTRVTHRFSLGELARPKRRRGPISHDAAFFQDLVDELGPVYARLDAVMQATGIDGVATEMPRTLLPRRADAPPDVMEIGEVLVSPFDAWVWANSRWETTARMITECKPGQLDRTWVSGSIVASHMRNPRDERVWFRIVVKKHFDDVERPVVVWRVQAECKSDEFAGFRLDETGWTVVEALPEQYSRGSIVRTCVHFQFHQQGAAPISLGSELVVGGIAVELGSAQLPESDAFEEIMLRCYRDAMDDIISQRRDREPVGSVDVLLITADANDMPYDLYISLLRARGTCVMLGAPNDNVKFSPLGLIMKSKKFVGSLIGSIQDIKDMLAVAAEKNVRPIIQRLPMSRANDGIQMVRDGKARYRVVLEN